MRRRQALAVTLTAMIVGSTLAGGAAAPADAQDGARPAKQAATATTIDYVALGDSYSAGPLVPGPPAHPGSRVDPTKCVRSWNNYPAYLAGYLGVRTYTDVTCSGAQTADFYTPQGGDTPYVPPQLDALSADTDLVTVGIGGNDYGLFGSLVDTCGDLAAAHPRWKAPCQHHYTVRGVDTKARDAVLIQDRIATAAAAVKAAAPNAEVYFVAYPRLLPRSRTCDAVGFAAGDAAWGNHIERLLNRSLRNGAVSQGAHFVAMFPASRGHDACAGKDAWINGKQLVFGGPRSSASFHPFRTGERGVAREVYRVIAGKAAPTYKDSRPAEGSIVLNPPYSVS